jgi:hypothetical protein
MGQDGAVVGQVPHLGTFPWEKIRRRGAKKGGIEFYQIRFSASQTVHHHKISTLVVFWGEKRPWVERGGSIRKYPVPKNELIFCPDHWGGPFGPKFCEHLVMLFDDGVHLKKSHFQTFTQLNPSAKRPYMRWMSIHGSSLHIHASTFRLCLLAHTPKICIPSFFYLPLNFQ